MTSAEAAFNSNEIEAARITIRSALALMTEAKVVAFESEQESLSQAIQEMYYVRKAVEAVHRGESEIEKSAIREAFDSVLKVSYELSAPLRTESDG